MMIKEHLKQVMEIGQVRSIQERCHQEGEINRKLSMFKYIEHTNERIWEQITYYLEN